VDPGRLESHPFAPIRLKLATQPRQAAQVGNCGNCRKPESRNTILRRQETDIWSVHDLSGLAPSM
jgi:hypothetical protein